MVISSNVPEPYYVVLLLQNGGCYFSESSGDRSKSEKEGNDDDDEVYDQDTTFGPSHENHQPKGGEWGERVTRIT